MEEDTGHTKEDPTYQGLPASGSGYLHTTSREKNDRRVATEHFSLVTPTTPLQLVSFAIPGTGQIPTATRIPIEQSNIYDVLAQQGSGAAYRDIEKLSFGLVSGANTTTSGSMGSRGRDPIPLAPKILHLLDRLEPDKGKQARMLTDHPTG